MCQRAPVITILHVDTVAAVIAWEPAVRVARAWMVVTVKMSAVTVPQFMREQAESDPDPRRIVAQLVEFWRGAFPRTTPFFRIIREAAAADPEIAALERGRSAQRLRNYRQAAQLLAGRNALRP